MLQSVSKNISERILVCAPFGRDAELIERELVRAGLSPCQCSPLKELCRCIDEGAGAALISDHAFGRNGVAMLAETLSGQPLWSALPILVMTSGGGTTVETRSVLRALEPISNLTVLERPLRPDTLISCIRAALRTRRQQYQIQDYVSRLQESETTLQTYLDNTGNGIYVVDHATGRILDANKRAVELVGYSRDELLQLSISDIERGLTGAVLSGFSRRQLRGVVEMEGANRRKDGSTFPVEIHLTSLAPTLPTRVLAVMRDITERKRVELELAEEARRKDEFLALLGHEMRNPLAAISTSLEVLSGNCTGAQRLQLRQATVRQVGMMRRLLDDLLDLNRITHGQIELVKESLDLAEFLEKTAASMRSTIAERRQKLIVRHPSKPVEFMADRIRLTQIVANLLGNASKYTGAGGRIELSGAVKGSEMVLRCKDNGQGILPESTEAIFEPFSRGPNARDSYGEASLGIGLALVRQLVELHGGTISVASGGAGMGSEFTVRLPLIAPPSRQAAASDLKSEPATQRPCSVVIVEDNPVVATSMKMALEQAGHRVNVFSDGPRALAGVDGLEPDAIVLDIGLSGMDGYELAAKLKRKRKMRGALFIAVSGFEQKHQAEEKSDYFDHYFIKPVEVSTLLNLFTNYSRDGAKGEALRKAPEPKQTKRPRRPRVLLVEDHPLAADATASLLRLEGLDVRTALTGREALEAAPKFQPQLILCDMRLGDMNGLEVIRELRSNLPANQTRAVILTGFSGPEIREINRRADEFGVDEVMSKPLEPPTIRKLAAKLGHP
ncbi:MAG TPA: response regulator [Terriglobia bacterium]|nr:response regulator [Terriglobia bacterium]